MIIEALTHLLTPAPQYVKKMGYLKEAIAIEARVKRCQGAWQPHLDKCKSLILEQAEALPRGSSIMILGSGGFHDVPIKRLSALSHHITCVDIVHLPKVKKRYPQVTFMERDVTGLNENLYNAVNKGVRVSPAQEWEFIKTPDLIVSLNLLSQLALKMISYAEMHDNDLGILFQNNVLKAHVEWLQKQNTNVLLISDIAREYYEGGNLLESVPSLPKMDMPEPSTTWKWDIAPKGEADKDISVVHHVGTWKM
ncbi:MAG: hypothetical protein P8J14_05495 [Emcibacteraceae bacterium]|nr:hypothetical protein [Emcibacteraceae bacterium]